MNPAKSSAPPTDARVGVRISWRTRGRVRLLLPRRLARPRVVATLMPRQRWAIVLVTPLNYCSKDGRRLDTYRSINPARADEARLEPALRIFFSW